MKEQHGRYPLAGQQSQYPLAGQYPLKGLQGQYLSNLLWLYPSDFGKSLDNSPQLSGQQVMFQFYVPTKNRPSNQGGQPQSALEGQYQTKVFGRPKRGNINILVPT